MFALVRSAMAGAAKMPRAMASPLHTTDAAALVAELAAVQQRSPKLVRSSVYPAPADPSISVRSWKMNEFKYYDIPSPFPTYARGLFTVDDRIVARGYDKFFNIGEVPWTEVCPPEPLCSSLTHSRAVVISRIKHPFSLHSLSQVQRMHHLHRRTHALQARHNLQALPWPGCRPDTGPRSSR
jgi:hypothetical protein